MKSELTCIGLVCLLWLGEARGEQPDLPSPNHPMWFGYYYEDAPRYGDFQAEVEGYTNLYYAAARVGYEKSSNVTDEQWLPIMQQALKRVAGKRKILLNLNQGDAEDRVPPLEKILAVAASCWDSVELIELGDEPPWNKAQTQAKVRSVRKALRDRGLADKPIGVTLEQKFSLTTNAVEAQGLDFVGIEAYVDPPGSDDSSQNTESLKCYVERMKARVPADKKLVLIMMAYNRNGAWTNRRTLVDLQYQAYLLACDDPRVIGLTMFAYGRPGGTRDHPELQKVHRRMAEAIGRARRDISDR